MSESESDTIVKLRQEVYNLKIENAELLGYNTHLKTAFNRLKASIEKDMETTEELRKDMRGKIVGLEEAKMRITQLEKELMNRKQVPELSKCEKNMIEDLKNQLSNQINQMKIQWFRKTCVIFWLDVKTSKRQTSNNIISNQADLWSCHSTYL